MLRPTPQNGQTHSNNSLAKGDELFESVWPFCGVGGYMVNIHVKNIFEMKKKWNMKNETMPADENLFSVSRC